MKRCLVCLLAALVFVTMLAVPVLAAGGRASVSSASGKPGDTVSVTVSLADFAPASSIGIRISSDMTLVSGSWSIDGALKNVSAGSGAAAWAAAYGETVGVNGDVLTLQFRIPQQEAVKNYPVTVDVIVKNGSTVLGSVTAEGTVTVSDPADDALPGDVNADGVVDMKDAATLQRHVLKAETISDPASLANADVTGDGAVDMKDAAKLMQYALKAIDSLA